MKGCNIPTVDGLHHTRALVKLLETYRTFSGHYEHVIIRDQDRVVELLKRAQMELEMDKKKEETA
jgi:hypothetical protein